MINSDRTHKGARKQAVSIRMSRGDVRNIKRLAERLGARDSDVIRFAIKLMLSRMAPLQDPTVTGRSLVPVFIESGPELMRHFELDAARLASILNDGAEESRRVELDDVQLLALSSIQRSYLKLQPPRPSTGGSAVSDGRVGSFRDSVFPAQGIGDSESVEQSLRQYLVDKYLYRHITVPNGGQGNGT